jgi:hypothetical protein
VQIALGRDADIGVIEMQVGRTNTPAFCANDSNGNLWVTNIGGPNVTEYKKGSTTHVIY